VVYLYMDRLSRWLSKKEELPPAPQEFAATPLSHGRELRRSGRV
jgi:hypothetical protein